MSQPSSILTIEPFDLPPDEIRKLTNWLGDNQADCLRNVVSHEIAKEAANAVNAEFNLVQLPNYAQDKEKARERMVKFIHFIEIFDELRTRSVFRKITITPNKL